MSSFASHIMTFLPALCRIWELERFSHHGFGLQLSLWSAASWVGWQLNVGWYISIPWSVSQSPLWDHPLFMVHSLTLEVCLHGWKHTNVWTYSTNMALHHCQRLLHWWADSDVWHDDIFFRISRAQVKSVEINSMVDILVPRQAVVTPFTTDELIGHPYQVMTASIRLWGCRCHAIHPWP
jgi:hypothetical protein